MTKKWNEIKNRARSPEHVARLDAEVAEEATRIGEPLSEAVEHDERAPPALDAKARAVGRGNLCTIGGASVVGPMTPAELQAIRERAEAATPGPWKWCGCGLCGLVWSKAIDSVAVCLLAHVDGEALPDQRANALFVESARTDVPALCDEVERVQGELAEASEAVRCFPLVVKRAQKAEADFYDARATIARLTAEVARLTPQPTKAPGYGHDLHDDAEPGAPTEPAGAASPR